MRLFRFLAVPLLLLPLAACDPGEWVFAHILGPLNAGYTAAKAFSQTEILNPLNDRTVAALGITLGTANGAVIAYGALPRCPAGQPVALAEVGPDGKLCHDAALLKALLADMKLAVGVYEQLVALQKTHPQGTVLFGGPLSQKFAEAQKAVGVVTDLVNAYVATRR